MTLAPEQLARLRRAKLAALVRDLGGDPGGPVDVGTSAASISDGRAWVLVPSGSAGALAGALLWCERAGAHSLTLFVDADADAPTVARWTGYFGLGAGAISVRSVDGATSNEAMASPVPEPVAVPDIPDELLDHLRDADVEIVVEHGYVRGEVLGLEVARLVRWPTEVGGDGELHLEAGVGRFDRDAVAAARPDEAPAESLARTVAQVRAHRYPGAPVHAVQLLVRERWLRSMVVEDPQLVGASQLVATEMTTEATGLRDVHPAAAVGTDPDGGPVVVVCSTGVDLSLVPLAADTRRRLDPDARLVLALPARDHHGATRTLVELLRGSAELVDVAPGWG